MNIAFITKEKLSYDEAPPSRILNIKKILDRHHDVSIISQESNWKKDENIYEVSKIFGGFIGNQIFKLVMLIVSLHVMFSRKIDFFIAREYYFVVMLYPFTKLFGRKILYDMHCFRHQELNIEGKNLKSRFIKPFEILAHKLSYRILAISPGILNDLPKELRKKAIMVPNGVDLEIFDKTAKDHGVLKKYNIPKDKPIIGFVGNWMEWVDVPTFLNSSRYIEDATFLIIGKGYRVKSFGKLKKLYPNVIFTDNIAHIDVIKLLKLMDICVLPYKKAEVVKHLSVRKTQEYLAAGKAIVVSNSDIADKPFLKENKNAVYYKSEDSKDLALKIKYLLSNKKLMNLLAKNNKRLSKKFSWEYKILNSKLLELLNTYTLLGKTPTGKVSIIIKAFNEERCIERCIKSALNALKGLKGEVILIDSKSNDKTVELAKRYPIKIVQLNNEKERRCGIGPQIGFLCSKGDYIYILDGDMELDKNFIKKVLPYFNNNKIAGIGGNIIEKSKENLVFQVRSRYHQVKKITEVNQLGMGGLYKRKAIEDIGYFSNPYFFAYEEYDIGAKLTSKGYKMLRIPKKMVKHYGDETTSFETLEEKWKSKYLFGSGQYLRISIKDHHFLKTFNELKIYIFSILWLLFGLISIISLIWFYNLFITYIIFTSIILFLLLIRKKSFKKLVFSISSWNLQSLGMFRGFLLKNKSPFQFRPNVKVIK